MSDRPGRVRWLLGLLGVSVVAGVVLVVWLNRQPHQPPGPQPSGEKTFPVPGFSASRSRNTGAEAHYIGIAACAECHRTNHASYLLTAHSRALADLDPQAEPPDGSFEHPPSGRSYRVYREDGQLRHEETLRTADGKTIAGADHPIRYVIGSGHFSRSYLVEVDGFLHESPITWYASKKRWDLSPGYDSSQHWSFERPTGLGCLACHSGSVERLDGTQHRLAVHEKAIGCERCHGPGSLHAEYHRSGTHPAGQEDLTIVNPGRLPRPLLESICSECHLSGVASVYVRGRKPTDFRPGMPLTDYRVEYSLESGSEQMTVVGHMDQLRQSVCYQKSKDLTCLTCHDPHEAEKPADLTAFYRQKCLGCHTVQACGLEQAQRLSKDPADNCVACHMPSGDTDIPHIAFTHHRIGRHTTKPAPAPAPTRAPDLVATDDVSRLPALDQQRNLGLAYVVASRSQDYPQYADAFAERARTALEAVQAAGLHDGDSAEALAEMYWKKDPVRARSYGRQALEAKDAAPDVRATALILLADLDMKDGDFESAIALLKEAVELRRYSEDWRMLGVCYLMLHQPWQALPAFQQAVAIQPYRYDIHFGLAEAYHQLGNAPRSKEHLEKGQWLFQHRKQ
jgi:predicted CXXCH cytochrome family protein